MKGKKGQLSILLCLIMLFSIACTPTAPVQVNEPAVPQQAVEEEKPFTYADTIAWDAAYDVVVIGFGGAGGVSAITAADLGSNVLILEKAPKGEEGGNTKYAGQFVSGINPGDYDAALAYFKALRYGFDTVSDEILEWFVSGLAETRNWMVSMGMSPDSVTFQSCEYPELANGFKLTTTLPEGKAFQNEFNGEYWNLINRNVLSRSNNIDVWYASPATHLIQDPQSKAIVGVEAQRDGKTYRIRANNGVIMACGGFENNKEMIQCYTQNDYLYPVGTLHNTGDGILMAIEVNAKLWHMSALSGPFVGYVCEEFGEGRVPFETMDQNVTSGLSMINVGPDAKRFTDESQKTRHGHVYHNGEYAQQYLFDHMYAIFDEETRLAGPIYKGWSQDNSKEVERGTIIKADTIEELAGKIELDPTVLSSTVKEYNENCRDGYDPYFNRPADKLVPIGKGPYYALKLVKSLINTQGGAQRNVNCEVMDNNGNIIPNLYSAGEFGAIVSDIYQGGCNLAETIISGRTAGKNASESKQPLPVFVQVKAVAQKDVGRLTFPEDQDEVFEATANNEFIGTGTGVSLITVKVTLDGDKITGVVILNQKETVGVADMALQEIPNRIIAANSPDVDVVSGASKTSRGIMEAVKNALASAPK